MEPKEGKAKRSNGVPARDVEEWVNEEDGRVKGNWTLAHRRILLDQSTVAILNLAILL